nr:transposon Ty3-G Gag-Pol polyprotein [Tanacetum cinerariifolium]
MSQTTTSPPCSQITKLLHFYQDVFVTPTSLLPKRKQDHRIPLVPNTPPINIRPYKHSPNQKDVVEAMVQELMASGVIRGSQSPYSSPIVMVKKKDGALTAFTIGVTSYETEFFVCKAMRQNSLYAKMSKCNFAAKQVEYLGYYRRFIKNYASISKPLTSLLKNSFAWNSSAQASFEGKVNQTKEKATWKLYTDLLQRYSHMELHS